MNRKCSDVNVVKIVQATHITVQSLTIGTYIFCAIVVKFNESWIKKIQTNIFLVDGNLCYIVIFLFACFYLD